MSNAFQPEFPVSSLMKGLSAEAHTNDERQPLARKPEDRMEMPGAGRFISEK